MTSTRCRNATKYARKSLALLLVVVILPMLLGAWREGGKGINPAYVARIKDGQTSKHEILLLFGDPQEVDRTSDGVTFIYKSFVDEPPPSSKNIYKEPEEQSMSRYVLDEDKKIKPKVKKKEGKILKATLAVRFKPGSDTVLTHEYKEFGGKQ